MSLRHVSFAPLSWPALPAAAIGDEPVCRDATGMLEVAPLGPLPCLGGELSGGGKCLLHAVGDTPTARTARRVR